MSRIAHLPRRVPFADAPGLVAGLTAWLRAPSGTQSLRPIQACALAELAEQGGLFASARVGAGKTLISGLAPLVTNAQRPMLFNPAALLDKTRADFRAARVHWRIPVSYRLESYTRLGLRPKCRVHGKHPCQCERADLIEEFKPDLLVFDEAHKLKNVRAAACARRVARYVHAHPECKVCVLSGSPQRKSILDFAHLLLWALRSKAPLPEEPDTLKQWAALIDDIEGDGWAGSQQDGWTRLDYSILAPHLGPCHDGPTARAAFASRLRETPGVVISDDRFDDVALEITPVRLPPREDMRDHWTRLREVWAMPDDWLLLDKQLGVWGAAQRFALGFWFLHEPRPPTDWVEARREWQGFVRRVLEASPQYDSMAQVRDACLAGALPRQAWDAWAALAKSYEPRRVVRWLHTDAIERAAHWGREGGVIWSEWPSWGRALAEYTGWPYFGEKGLDTHGRLIDACTDKTVICSRVPCSEGHNMQPHDGLPGWHRMLYTTPPKTALDWEQSLGREHRDGQTHDVHAEYLVGCLENFVALPCAVAYAQRTEETLTHFQKLLQADRTEPPMAWAVGPAYGLGM